MPQVLEWVVRYLNLCLDCGWLSASSVTADQLGEGKSSKSLSWASAAVYKYHCVQESARLASQCQDEKIKDELLKGIIPVFQDMKAFQKTFPQVAVVQDEHGGEGEGTNTCCDPVEDFCSTKGRVATRLTEWLHALLLGESEEDFQKFWLEGNALKDLFQTEWCGGVQKFIQELELQHATSCQVQGAGKATQNE